MALISSRQFATPFNFGPKSSFRARRGRAMAATLHTSLAIVLLLVARFAARAGPFAGRTRGLRIRPDQRQFHQHHPDFYRQHHYTVTAITALTDGALNQDFAVTGQSCLGTLSPPASCLITLTFKPSQLGLRRGELLITDGTGTYANRVPLHGVGLGPQVVFNPAVSSTITTLPSLSPATFSPVVGVIRRIR